MALEFLCSNEILKDKSIKIPQGANCYRCKSGNIKFFMTNPEKRFKELPKVAKYVSFEIEGNRFTLEYGNPKFYDLKGNILNIPDY